MASSSETYVNSDDGDISEEFHKHFWKYAIGGIIVILIGFMAYKIIDVIVNNPVTKTINDLVGDAGLLLKDFTENCCSQSDCPNISTQDECESGCGCGWDDKGSKCKSTTGATVDTGAWYSFKCPLFVGLCAFLLFKLGAGLWRLFKNRKTKPSIDAASLVTSVPPDELAKKVGKQIRMDFEEWKKEKDKKEEKYTEAEARYMADRIGQINFNQLIVEPLKTSKNDQWAAADQNAKERYIIAKEAAGNDVDTDKLDKEAEEIAGTDPVNHGE